MEREREEVIIFVGENICRQRKQYKMGRERGSDDNTKMEREEEKIFERETNWREGRYL